MARFSPPFFYPGQTDLAGNGDTGIFSFADSRSPPKLLHHKIDHRFSPLMTAFRHLFPRQFKADPAGLVRRTVIEHRVAAPIGTLQEQHIFSPGLLNRHAWVSTARSRLTGRVQGHKSSLADAHRICSGQFVGRIVNVPGLTDFTGGLTRRLKTQLSSSSSYTWNSFPMGRRRVFHPGESTPLQFGAVVERMQDNLESTLMVNGSFTFASWRIFDQPGREILRELSRRRSPCSNPRDAFRRVRAGRYPRSARL